MSTSRFDPNVDHGFDDRLPVASGLNPEWLKTQKSKKKGSAGSEAHRSTEDMDDEAALSTRPDFPLSPKFDRNAANERLEKAKPSKRNPSRKNAVHFTI